MEVCLFFNRLFPFFSILESLTFFSMCFFCDWFILINFGYIIFREICGIFEKKYG